MSIFAGEKSIVSSVELTLLKTGCKMKKSNCVRCGVNESGTAFRSTAIRERGLTWVWGVTVFCHKRSDNVTIRRAAIGALRLRCATFEGKNGKYSFSLKARRVDPRVPKAFATLLLPSGLWASSDVKFCHFAIEGHPGPVEPLRGLAFVPIASEKGRQHPISLGLRKFL